MIGRRILLSLLSAAMLAVSILPKSGRAQATSTQTFNKLAPAFALDAAGHSAQAIAAAEELVRSGTLSRTEQADVLDFEAMCYRELDQPDKAVHALEAAEAVLRPEDAKQQAATLHILGQVYVSRGNGAVGAHLYERAFRIYEAISDYGGMVRVADDQAAFALREKRDRQARKYLERADREAKSPNLLDKDDLAALTAMHGLLALNEGDPSRAVESYRRALALWTESHGQQYLATAWVTILLGQAQALNGQYSEGARTMEKGLVLTKATSGESSSRYLAAEMAYAKVLDRMGQNSRAATLRQDVATKQAALNAGSCRNCTVSVVALH